MRARRVLAAALPVLFALTVPALASPSGVVISGFQVRGPAGGNDEYVEIRNTAAFSVDISGWLLQGCAGASPGTAANRATIPSVSLAPGQYYLFTNSGSNGYSGSERGDQSYGTGFADFRSSNYAGIQLLDASSIKQDGVGSPRSPCREGPGLTTPTANGSSNAYLRIQDTDDNAADFSGPQASAPHPSGGVTPPPCANDGLHIYAIQGSGHVSPYNAQCVANVPGIVTQVVNNGFYMQDGDGDGNAATSDGIFVFTSRAPGVSAGQQVKVSGTVSEFRPGSSFTAANCPASSGACNLTVTEIVGATAAPAWALFTNTTIVPVVIGTGGRIPPTAIIDGDAAGSVEAAARATYDPVRNGIDFYESLEGMLVQVNDARVVGPTNRFGEIWLIGDNGANATGTNARGGLTLIDVGGITNYNPERIMIDVSLLASAHPQVDVGDTTPTVVGTVSYGFGNFRILPTRVPSFNAGGLARANSTVASGSDRLRIASYNVENLDPNDDDRCDGAPDRDVADGRFIREAQQIVDHLAAPDVLGIEEVQDNTGCTDDGTVDATFTLDMLVEAIVAAGGPRYRYASIDPVNNRDGGVRGGNIRQAILYNPARVALVSGTVGAGDATTGTALSIDVRGELQLSLSPGRIDPTDTAWTTSRKPLAATLDFNGRRVLVIVNHFNSKGGDEPLFGRFQSPVRASATRRVQQARVVHDFIRHALDLDASASIVCLGDFNDFDFSDPMRTLTGIGDGVPILFDLGTALLPAEERYSYVFEGNSQELDHIYVTNALLAQAEFQPVHVNAEFADQVSDHDPIVASLRMPPPPPVADAGADQSVVDLTRVTLNGRRSHARDGSVIAYQWTQTAGRPVVLNAASSAQPTFRAPRQPGDLSFSLTVTDRFSAQAVDTVVVHVLPRRSGS